MKIHLPPPRIYKLSPLALTLFCLSAGAAQFDSTVTEDAVGDPSVIIGSKDNRLSTGIRTSKDVTVDTKESGNIDVFSATYGIVSTFSKAHLAVGSNNTANLNIDTKYVKGTTNGFAKYIYGVNFSGLELNLNASDINIDVDGESDKGAYGLALGTGVSDHDVTTVIGSKNTKSLNITANGTDSTGLSSLGYTESTSTTVLAQNITITSVAEKNAYGVYTDTAHISLAGETLSIKSSGSQKSAAVYAVNATTELKAGTINIESRGNPDVFAVYASKSDTTIDGGNITVTSEGHGVFVNNGTPNSTAPAGAARMVINGNNTVINAAGSGLLAFSNGYLEVNGNLEVNAFNAIDTRGHSTININKDQSGTVVLNGNITFETPGASAESGDVLDSNVNVYLTGDQSSWTGNVYKEYNAALDGNEEKTKVENLYLYLSDGAQWNATNIGVVASELVTDTTSFINTLEMSDGIINTASDLESIKIDKLEGSGGQINLLATTDGETVDSASVSIGSASEKTKLTVTARGITADDVTDADKAMNSLNDKVTFIDSNAAAVKQNVIAQGDVIGELTQDVNAAGETSAVRVAENTKLASFKAVNASAIAAWRDEVAYTNQHLDFLRDNDHAYGAWAQVYGGESTFDDADMDLTSTTVQVGFDTLLGGWVTGVAASYMEGDADMTNGSADVDGYTFALYTERRFDNGFFVNGIARYGRLSTDATAENMSASYDNNAFSVGANAGYRFTFAKCGFIEPSIGLQYALVKGDDFTSSNGVKVEQDDYNALIADIGARLGVNFADNKGRLYARAYVNHDFDGDLDGKAYNDKAAAAMDVDLGGTWVTYGIGTQMNFTDNFTVYANFDRSSGNEVDTDYTLNAGLRYTF